MKQQVELSKRCEFNVSARPFIIYQMHTRCQYVQLIYTYMHTTYLIVYVNDDDYDDDDEMNLKRGREIQSTKCGRKQGRCAAALLRVSVACCARSSSTCCAMAQCKLLATVCCMHAMLCDGQANFSYRQAAAYISDMLVFGILASPPPYYSKLYYVWWRCVRILYIYKRHQARAVYALVIFWQDVFNFSRRRAALCRTAVKISLCSLALAIANNTIFMCPIFRILHSAAAHKR